VAVNAVTRFWLSMERDRAHNFYRTPSNFDFFREALIQAENALSLKRQKPAAHLGPMLSEALFSWSSSLEIAKV
jgi:hypothetical protein